MENCMLVLEKEHKEALEKETAEAYETLESNLTESDIERLHAIRHEISHHINWGRVVSLCFSELLTSMEKIVFEGGKKITSQGHPPFAQLFPMEQEFMQEKDIRGNYLLLQLVKKLLGALKTRTNQSMNEIPFLDADNEEELRELILDNEQELISEDDSPYDSETRRKFLDFSDDDIAAKYTEEEMDLVEECEEDNREIGKGFQNPMPHESNITPISGNIVIQADFHRPESDTNCHHNSTTTTFITENDGIQYLRQYCKMCRQVVRKEKVGEMTKTVPSNPEECKHAQVLWVKGKEGQEAYCTNCNLAPVPDPGKYNWVYAGLEPYGDDPSLDQILNLEEAMGCES